jgi:hypothetical protein
VSPELEAAIVVGVSDRVACRAGASLEAANTDFASAGGWAYLNYAMSPECVNSKFRARSINSFKLISPVDLVSSVNHKIDYEQCQSNAYQQN